jgi:hypothetical protein
VTEAVAQLDGDEHAFRHQDRDSWVHRFDLAPLQCPIPFHRNHLMIGAIEQ